MIRILPGLIILLLLSIACNHKSDIQSAIVAEEDQVPDAPSRVDTLHIDLTQSKISWKGTKMRGAGKHEGDIQFKSAYLLVDNGNLEGGNFIVDMASIEVTDMPAHETIPRRNLKNHLRSDDFFDVEEYPTARFSITDIAELDGGNRKVRGNLTIKDVTKNIEFMSFSDGSSFATTFKFDRFEWNIAYEGNWIDKTLVDRDIELTIQLRLKNSL